MSYLKQRHNTYYARMGIPAAARPILGRNELVKFVKATSKALTERLVLAYVSIGLKTFFQTHVKASVHTFQLINVKCVSLGKSEFATIAREGRC